jgi:hypothetical protein
MKPLVYIRRGSLNIKSESLYGASLSASDPTLCRSSIGIRTRRSPSGIEGSASCSFEETCSREDTAQYY